MNTTNGQLTPDGPVLGVRGKLALGFVALLAILIFLGGESIALLSRLGSSIEVILRENYRSVIACERMKESLERMDSAALFALGGEVEQGRALAARNHPRFEEALNVELNNITLPGEAELAERLRQLYATYRPALTDYLAVDRPTEERRRIYFGKLLPVFQQIKGTADEILLLNQHNMEESDTRAKALAHSATRRMTLLLVLGSVLGIAAILLLARAILGPLGSLTRAAKQIEGGNLDVSVPVTSRDELGELAATFNSMAGGLRELRRSDQARLLRAQQTSQQAIDQLPEAVAVFSESGEVELVNATAADVLGLRPGEPVPAQHESWISLLVSQGMPTEAAPGRLYQEPRRLQRDGEEGFFLPRTIPLGDERRQLGTLLILEDVTERRRSAEMTSDLLANASRKLRAPLDALASSLRQGNLDNAEHELSRLGQAIDNLDAMARLEGRREQLHVQAVSPQSLLDAAADEFRSSAERGGVKLAVDAAPEIPRVLADATRVKLVLGFLVDNALANTPAGGSVTLRANTADHDRVRFAVTDTGQGIPQEHLGHIFERFYQVPGTEDRGRAGLGLPISKDIVQSHGGEIHVESREGRGTTVWFTLPSAKEV